MSDTDDSSDEQSPRPPRDELERLIGLPFEASEMIDPGEMCNARRSTRVSKILDPDTDSKLEADDVPEQILSHWDPEEGEQYEDADDPKLFAGYCRAAAGTRTDHPGVGRCHLHGGCSPTGRDNGRWKHGLFSDALNAEDRAIMEGLEDMTHAEMLDHLIRLNLTKVRRALKEEDEGDFWEAFNRVVKKTGDIGDSEIRELAGLLEAGNQKMDSKMDLIRRLILAHQKITDGEQFNIRSKAELGGGAELSLDWSGPDPELLDQLEDEQEEWEGDSD